MTITVIGFVIMTLANIFFANKIISNMAEERERLLDRIQAGTLQEYKYYTEPPEPKEKVEKEIHNYV